QHWFVLSSGDVSTLDQEQLNDAVREAFKNKGWVFTDKAKVKVEQSGNTWIIKDGDVQIFVHNEQQIINIYLKQKWFILAPKPVHVLNS
ncbi:MAG: hypothetical protein J0653_02945, partial [Deltaproteobacteria bacterium]|nr:hypothetical protein [Deltaproteobacteria bacterium]